MCAGRAERRIRGRTRPSGGNMSPPHPRLTPIVGAVTVVVAICLQLVGAIPARAATPTRKLSVADIAVAEGNSGTKLATVTVTLTSGTGTASVEYATSNVTAWQTEDYTGRSGTLNFAANVT